MPHTRFDIMSKVLISALICALCLPVSAKKSADGGWTLSTDDPSAKYYAVPIANGQLGITAGTAPFQVRGTMLNNVYDSRKGSGVSTHFKTLNPFVLSMSIDGSGVTEESVSRWRQTLDMKKACLETAFRHEDRAEIRYSIRALRGMPYAGLVSVDVKAIKDIEINVQDTITAGKRPALRDSGIVSKWVGEPKYDFRRLSVITPRKGIVMAAANCLFTDEGPWNGHANIRAGEVFRFHLVGAVTTGTDFADPENEALREVIYAVGEGSASLIGRHEELWDELWQGDIIIEGDDDAQKLVRAALYNLYSSCRGGTSASIPPFGLSSSEYCGHIFWDSELWMYPPMLFLAGDIAESMTDYRIDRLEGAKRKAYAHGYRGAMFPWESDRSGDEACDPGALTGAFEHHISSCVALALWNRYRMTGDREWLEHKALPVLIGVADFWVSRVTANSDGSMSIKNVICPDEYAHGKDDNAFTNAAAAVVLRAAAKACDICGKDADPQWTETAERLRIPVKEGITMEYEGYDGAVIKQTDANLLAYPLQTVTDPDAVRRDLEYYESKLDPAGPAMSFAIPAIEWARLGDRDKTDALWRKTVDGHTHGAFLAFSETAGKGDTCFMTGYGGVLQAVINGFCGLELTDDGVRQMPAVMPKGWKSVTVKGVGPQRLTFKNTSKK